MIREVGPPSNVVPVIGPVTGRPGSPPAVDFPVVALAPRTREAYRSDWSDFAQWCATRGYPALPATASTVVAYVEDLVDRRRVATAKRRLAAIRAVHLQAGHPVPTDTPTVTAAMTRARWRQRDAVDPTTPITVAELRAMSRALPASLGGLRDRAAILVGYGGALRPSELVALGMADVSVGHAGLRLATARGAVHVPFGSERALCAVTAFEEWTRAARLTDGPVLRAVDRCGRVGTGALGQKAVGRIVRRAAAAAGLPPERFTGLSLRRGMVAAAAARGSSRHAIMRQTGHRSERVVRGYLEVAGTPAPTRTSPTGGAGVQPR